MKTNNIIVSEKYGVITVNGAPVRDVTNPIQAQDLHTPRVVPISPRRWLVVGYKSEQVAELENIGGKYTPFAHSLSDGYSVSGTNITSKQVRARL